MITVAFDGPDGAGKTPCLAVVADLLAHKGATVHVCAPFHGLDVYPLWATDPMEAADRIRRVIDLNIELAARDARDIVLFDRHWPTVAVSTINWRAVDYIRQSHLDHLFLLVPPEPRKKEGQDPNDGPWMKGGIDSHWVAYRCLVEGVRGIHRPRTNRSGMFAFPEIAQEVAWCCGV